MLLHWVLYWGGFQRARTQTTEDERLTLKELAAGRTSIAELGVFEGVTSRLFREAMSPHGMLWCVDPFERGRLGFSYGFSISAREIEQGSGATVCFIEDFSYRAAKHWRHEIELLFIDADHSYDAVRQDWNDWSPFVVQGGHVALHDSRVCLGRTKKSDGPVRLVAELRATEQAFRIAREVDTLTVFERIA